MVTLEGLLEYEAKKEKGGYIEAFEYEATSGKPEPKAPSKKRKAAVGRI